MNPPDAPRRIINVKENHDKLKLKWLNFIELFKEFVCGKKLEGSEAEFPELILDENQNKFHLYFTVNPIFCEFSQYYDLGCIFFGYTYKDKKNRFKDRITDIIYFDIKGNVRDKDGNREGTNITTKDSFVECSFPRVLKALELNMDQVKDIDIFN